MFKLVCRFCKQHYAIRVKRILLLYGNSKGLDHLRMRAVYFTIVQIIFSFPLGSLGPLLYV